VGCNNGGGGGNFSKVKRLIQILCLTPNFFLFFAVPVWDVKKNFSPELILSIKPRMHISPWSWAVGKLKKFWIQTYFGPVTVYSVEIPSLRHFAF